MIKLSIIIPAHSDRIGQLPEIVRQLNDQIGKSDEVELLVLLDNGSKTTGKKLDLLNKMASGEWVASAADDDLVADDYVASLLEAIGSAGDAEVLSFDHTYYVNGEFKALVKVGKEYIRDRDDWAEQISERYPSSMCAIRRKLATMYVYPDISDRENLGFIQWLKSQDPIEKKIGKVLYHHMWNESNKGWRKDVADRWKRKGHR